MAAEFHTEGLKFLLECLSEVSVIPAAYYVGLATDASPPENSTVAALTEISDTGYARQTLNSDGTDMVSAAAGTNDRKLTLLTVNFANSSGSPWTAVNIAFLTDAADDSGSLIASIPLTGAPVTIADGEDLDVTFVLQLNG